MAPVFSLLSFGVFRFRPPFELIGFDLFFVLVFFDFVVFGLLLFMLCEVVSNDCLLFPL